MKSLLRIACSARIAHSALRVALVVGTVLNLVNQSGVILVGIGISWFHLLLNYFVPYCVASYSAAKNEITKREDED
ncbi:MAG: nitrate/nitrite transporter NrtS [Glaciimonas sp.]|nr:nitrate/nitrite transporter NrtS [Glaciimonas sp.]